MSVTYEDAITTLESMFPKWDKGTLGKQIYWKVSCYFFRLSLLSDIVAILNDNKESIVYLYFNSLELSQLFVCSMISRDFAAAK